MNKIIQPCSNPECYCTDPKNTDREVHAGAVYHHSETVFRGLTRCRFFTSFNLIPPNYESENIMYVHVALIICVFIFALVWLGYPEIFAVGCGLLLGYLGTFNREFLSVAGGSNIPKITFDINLLKGEIDTQTRIINRLKEYGWTPGEKNIDFLLYSYTGNRWKEYTGKKIKFGPTYAKNTLVTTKDLLYKSVGTAGQKFMMPQYTISQPYDFKGVPDKSYMVKPSSGHKGAQSIYAKTLQQAIDHITNTKLQTRTSDWVLSQYMEDQLLWDGHKFHIRMHLLQNKSGLYLFKTGTVFRSNIKLSNDQKSHNVHADSGAIIHIFPEDFDKKFRKTSILEQVAKFCQELPPINTCTYNETDNGYYIFGIDVMVNKKYEAKILEVNFSPGLKTIAGYTNKFMDTIYETTLADLPRNKIAPINDYVLIKSRKPTFLIDLYKPQSHIQKAIAKRLISYGWEESKNNCTDFMLVYKQLYKKYTHIKSNISGILNENFYRHVTNKQRLYHTLKKLGVGRFMPLQYDINEFMDDGIDDDKNLEVFSNNGGRKYTIDPAVKNIKTKWMVKPVFGRIGIGTAYLNYDDAIKHIKNSHETTREFDKENKIKGSSNWILSKYIADPVLVDGKKFHIRVHMLLNNIGGSTRLFLFKTGYMFVSNKKFDLSIPSTEIHNIHAHSGAKIRLFPKHFPKQHTPEQIWEQLTVLGRALKPTLKAFNYPDSVHGYSFFGLDVMISKKEGVKILEINGNPGLSHMLDVGADNKTSIDNFVDTLYETTIQHEFGFPNGFKLKHDYIEIE